MKPGAPDIVVIGGGGHAAVLIDALKAAGDARSLAIVDADPTRIGTSVLGVPIVGDDAALARLSAGGTRGFIVAVGGTRDNGPRKALFERALSLGFEPVSVVHARAVVAPSATLGPGTQVLAGAVVNARARVGANVIINTGAIVEHDCVVGDHVHLATGARLASTVSVGSGAHVGAGAVVRQLITIGSDAVVGAGAVVVSDVRPFAIVAGVPAKELRR